MQGASIDARLDHGSTACGTAYGAAAWGVRSADAAIARDGFDVRSRPAHSARRRRDADDASRCCASIGAASRAVGVRPASQITTRGGTDGGFEDVGTDAGR